MSAFHWVLGVCLAAFFGLQPASAKAAITEAQLAGNSLTEYPFFEYVKAFNENSPTEVAIDPTRFPGIVGQTCDIYVLEAKSTAGWAVDPSLTDVTTGGAQTESFGGATIQNNTFQVTGAFELNADAGLGLGVGYDVVLDCDQDGQLSDGDFIDGLGNEAGFYAVHDTTVAGPLAVTEELYNLDPGVGASFGIPAFKLAEDLYYPTDVGSMGRLPLIVISRGNGHNYQWYDHIGFHLASYGYIVMSHDNNTEPGVESAATTTLGHTDAFIDQAEAGAIAGGALAGHIDTSRITWIGHSRGGEGVVIAYDRLFDGSHTPTHFSREDIKLISSMLPTDFQATGITEPHDAHYHLWTASGDSDVDGSAACALCQTFHIHDRATGYRQSTVVQGTGHAWFHDGPESPPVFTGPCSIGPTNDLTHLIQLGHFLPMIKHYVEGNVPALDFLTRQYETFRPIGVPTGNSCIVVSHEYRNGSPVGNFMIDDYQTQPNTGISSSGGQVTFDVENLTEGRLDDNNSDFTWNAADPFNGATQADATDSSRGVVFDWTNQDHFYEWEVVSGQRDFSSFLYLSVRGAQGTQHPNTLAVLGDLTFSITLRDGGGTSRTINIGAFGGGLEQPYQRSGGWHNEMETIRIRLTDFLNNGSGLNLMDIVAVRLDVGPSWGSAEGRIVVDEIMVTNDRSPYLAPLRIAKADAPDPVAAGGELTYTLSVANAGPDKAIDVEVADTLPAGVTFVGFMSDAAVCVDGGGTVSCEIAEIMGSDAVDIALIVKVDDSLVDDVGSLSITNTAVVSSPLPDPDLSDNTVSEDTLVLPGCGGVLATIVGTPGDDNVIDTPADDVIATLAGDDRVVALRGGDDVICGGSGDDTILGRSGNNEIDGGPGDDNIAGGPGVDVISAGPGDDSIVAQAGDDTIDAGPGDDHVNAGSGSDAIDGGPGNDNIGAGPGDDIVDAGPGNDTISGGSGDDAISAGPGDDTVGAGSGDDTIDAGQGDDNVNAGPGDDTIDGGPGTDNCVGGEVVIQCE